VQATRAKNERQEAPRAGEESGIKKGRAGEGAEGPQGELLVDAGALFRTECELF
jgi:hypothetical protein